MPGAETCPQEALFRRYQDGLRHFGSRQSTIDQPEVLCAQKQLLVSGSQCGDQTTLTGIHNRSSRGPMVTQLLGTLIEMHNV
jgi:hypothetical protein